MLKSGSFSKLLTQVAALGLCVLFQLSVKAENGWELLRKNQYFNAEKAFLSDLEVDSTSLSSLEGLIFLSEIRQDKIRYKKYVSTLIRNHDESDLLTLFEDLVIREAADIIQRDGFSHESILPFRYSHGRQLKRERKFHESNIVFDEIINNINWALCGPFKNESGSGHIKVYSPEVSPFNLDQEMSSGDNRQLKWSTPTLKDESSKIFFHDHLPKNNLNVYYASSFLKFEIEQKIQFRIGRSAPIKVWLDDFLLFESNESINELWDDEIIELTIKAGTHRILLKYADYEPYDDTYNFLSFYDETRRNKNGSILFRITDNKGKLINNFTSSFEGSYSDTFYKPSINSRRFSSHFRNKYDQSQDDLFNQYCLAKALLKEGRSVDAEEFCVRLSRKNPESIFHKYLAAKTYAHNGKIEKAYEVLGNIAHSDAPIFGVYWEKFQDLDMENDETTWLALLHQLTEISPANKKIIKQWIKYYETNGLDNKKDSYIKKTAKLYPIHAAWLKTELEKSNKPRLQSSEKEEKSDLKTARKKLKTEFNTYYYNRMIRHYKSKENFSKVMSYYNELIQHTPYSASNRINKAKYLYQNEKYNDALSELKTALTIAPFKSTTYELIGDIYDDQKDKELALESYYQARKHASPRYIENILGKIEKIEGQKKLKSIFETKSFQSILDEEDQWSKRYESEDAVVLMYTRDFVVDSSNHIEIYQKMLIKILTESGANDWTEYNYGFMGYLNHVKVIKPDGSEVRPDVSGGLVVCKHLKPGDLIEVEGTQIESIWRGELGYDIFNTHYLSFDDPVYYAKIDIAIPKGTHLNYLTHKFEQEPIRSSNTAFDFYRWERHEIDPLINEDALVDELDLYAYVMTSSMKDWSKVVQWYQDKTYRRLESNYEILEILDSIINQGMSETDKVVAVYDYITKSVKYSYVAFLQSNYIPKRPGLTCSSGIGDCKDVATLMITMLRELDIEAYYVLVKSNQYDHEDMLPSLYFDHVIVGYVIDEEMHYADLTTDYYPYNSLVTMDVGAVGLLIKDNVTETIRLPNDHLNATKNTTKIFSEVTLKKDRSLNMKIAATYPGNAGGNLREIFSRMSDEERRNYIIDNTGNGIFDHLELIDYNLTNLDDLETPLKINYEFEAFTYSDEVMGLVIFSAPYTTNISYHPVFSTDKRHNDIDLSQITKIQPISQQLKIKFPEGYSLAKKPEDISLSSEFGNYNVSFSSNKKGMTIDKDQHFHQQIIPYSKFESLRDFYFKILEADATIIPLKAVR